MTSLEDPSRHPSNARAAVNQAQLEDLSALWSSCMDAEWDWIETLPPASIAEWEAALDPASECRPSAKSLPPPAFSILLHSQPAVKLQVSFLRQDVGRTSRSFEASMSCPELPQAVQEDLRSELRSRQDASLDEDLPLFALVEHIRHHLSSSCLHLPTPSSSSSPTTTASRPNKLTLKRALLWSHHLKAPSKRKDIVGWGRELGLWGCSKPGYPGVFVVEGMQADVDEFLFRIKRLNWQALQVRGEETEDFEFPPDPGTKPRDYALARCRMAVGGGDVRQRPEVVEVESMREVAKRLNEAGLQDLFKCAMKL